MQHGIEEEILPTLTLPRADLEAFAHSVTERFSNPFIKHYLLSISLNSVSKYKARILGHGARLPAHAGTAAAAADVRAGGADRVLPRAARSATAR